MFCPRNALVMRAGGGYERNDVVVVIGTGRSTARVPDLSVGA